MISGAGDTHSALRALVCRHRVAYEIAPAERIVDGERVAVGFDVTLYGTHADGLTVTNPGGPHCRATWEAHQHIAAVARPTEYRPSWSVIRPFDRALHISVARGERLDVELRVEVRHRRDYLAPVDDCERRCLGDIERALERLGVGPRVWKADRSRV